MIIDLDKTQKVTIHFDGGEAAEFYGPYQIDPEGDLMTKVVSIVVAEPTKNEKPPIPVDDTQAEEDGPSRSEIAADAATDGDEQNPDPKE